jgi:hypothetical protein
MQQLSLLNPPKKLRRNKVRTESLKAGRDKKSVHSSCEHASPAEKKNFFYYPLTPKMEKETLTKDLSRFYDIRMTVYCKSVTFGANPTLH